MRLRVLRPPEFFGRAFVVFKKVFDRRSLFTKVLLNEALLFAERDKNHKKILISSILYVKIVDNGGGGWCATLL